MLVGAVVCAYVLAVRVSRGVCMRLSLCLCLCLSQRTVHACLNMTIVGVRA